MKVRVAQSCPILCNLIDYILPGSSVHGILQARILEWVAIALSRESSQPRDQTQVSCIAGTKREKWKQWQIFSSWALKSLQWLKTWN